MRQGGEQLPIRGMPCVPLKRSKNPKRRQKESRSYTSTNGTRESTVHEHITEEMDMNLFEEQPLR